MRKPILVALLTLNMTAAQAAVVSPVFQLVQDCRALSPFPRSSLVDLSPEVAAFELESHLLQLFNFNDKISYFRSGASAEERNQLLMCQLHLADEFDALLADPASETLINTLRHSPRPELNQLAHVLGNLSQSRLPPEIKSRLYTAQAAYRHGLSQQSMQLEFPGPQCRLNASATEQPIDISIARYLMAQPSSDCRAKVWQAYQRRAAQRNQEPLTIISGINQQLADNANRADYAQLTLDSHYLSSPQLVMQFLESQTHNMGVAPWDIGRKLKQLPKARFNTLTPYGIFSLLTPALTELGLTLEQPAPTIYRLWNDGRLLGEIHLASESRPADYALVKPVIGRQFGTVLLLMPEKITNTRQLEQALTALAESIVTLGSGQQYYLLNHENQSLAIAQSWLSQWLNMKLAKQLPQPKDHRWQLMQAYSAQLQVFRGKLALAQAKGAGINTEDAADWFAQSFGHQWPNAQDALYGFSALADSGPEYYLPLWNQALGGLILAQTQCCISPKDVYNTLIINPNLQPLKMRLEELLNISAEPADIIRRLPHENQA
ncbi:M3 family metallopeptidase [Shewanella corallii]|uniref:M3 family metallopeptidase n=1 Tax=Shewanella corallii TaxID=560080 RepID=A0ABT0N8T1_9GAMM|nr:M3 family metallopeptidase [Shewanella corallii]MCL2914893.1 M3 family metallopeptidase [Shewanella corallii]